MKLILWYNLLLLMPNTIKSGIAFAALLAGGYFLFSGDSEKTEEDGAKEGEDSFGDDTDSSDGINYSSLARDLQTAFDGVDDEALAMDAAFKAKDGRKLAASFYKITNGERLDNELRNNFERSEMHSFLLLVSKKVTGKFSSIPRYYNEGVNDFEKFETVSDHTRIYTITDYYYIENDVFDDELFVWAEEEGVWFKGTDIKTA